MVQCCITTISAKGVKVVEGDLFQGTPKSAEGCGASTVFEQAKKEGLKIEVHFEDGVPQALYPLGNIILKPN